MSTEETAEEREARLIREALEATDARISPSGDSLIVRLELPITVRDEEHARLTVGPVKVRHMRGVRGAQNEVEAYAELLTTPEGALDEVRCEADYFALCRAVGRQLGKFREGGRPSSRT